MKVELHKVVYIGLSKKEYDKVQSEIGEYGRQIMMVCDVWKESLSESHPITKVLEDREIDGDIDVVVYSE